MRAPHAPPQKHRFGFSELVALAASLVCTYSVRQADPDLWGYLSAGKLFAERGGPVRDDPFAYTSVAGTWTPFEYGADLLLWWSYKLGGGPGLILLKCAVGGAALLCLYLLFRCVASDARIWLPLYLLSASGLSRYFLFRPQLFTFAFFAAFTLILVRHVVRGEAPLWLLPLFMVPWANLHGGFVAGLGAVALTIVIRGALDATGRTFEPRRLAPLVVTFLACVAATFATPLGIRLWSYVLTELAHGTNRRFINEWRPPTLSNDPWSLGVLVLLTATMLFVALASLRRRGDERPSLVWAASAVPLLAMAFMAARHVPLAMIWVGPIVALIASRLPIPIASSAGVRRAWFVMTGLGVVPACLTVWIVASNPSLRVSTMHTLGPTDPCTAVAFARSRGLEGRMYTPLWWGSYVTWQLYPSVKVSMDGRNVSLYSDDLVVENMTFFSSAEPAAIDAPIRSGSDLLLVPADCPLAPRLTADSRWKPLFKDSQAMLFVRADRGAARAMSDATPSFTLASCPATLE